jgi:hypothetical protein
MFLTMYPGKSKMTAMTDGDSGLLTLGVRVASISGFLAMHIVRVLIAMRRVLLPTVLISS